MMGTGRMSLGKFLRRVGRGRAFALIARGLMPTKFARRWEGVGKMGTVYGRIKCKSLRAMRSVKRWRIKTMVRIADIVVPKGFEAWEAKVEMATRDCDHMQAGRKMHAPHTSADRAIVSNTGDEITTVKSKY